MSQDARWHCFLDTNELWESGETLALLSDAAKGTGTRLYIPEPVIIERTYQLVRNFEENRRGVAGYEENRRIVQGLAESLGSIVPILSQEGLRRGVEIFEVQRIKLDFRDAVILLSSMSYAAENNLRACMFVSKNYRDFREPLQKLGPRQWPLVVGVSDLVTALKARPDVIAKLQVFMQSSRGHLQRHLESTYKTRLIQALIRAVPSERARSFSAASESIPMAFRIVSAIPQHPPESGKPCSISLDIGVDLVPPDMLHVTFYLTGKASVLFWGDEFVGTPDIQELHIGPPIR